MRRSGNSKKNMGDIDLGSQFAMNQRFADTLTCGLQTRRLVDFPRGLADLQTRRLVDFPRGLADSWTLLRTSPPL
jgi:hypothetical protein